MRCSTRFDHCPQLLAERDSAHTRKSTKLFAECQVIALRQAIVDTVGLFFSLGCDLVCQASPLRISFSDPFVRSHPQRKPSHEQFNDPDRVPVDRRRLHPRDITQPNFVRPTTLTGQEGLKGDSNGFFSIASIVTGECGAR